MRRIRAAAPVLETAAQLGAIRLLNPFVITGDSEGARRSRGFTYGARAIGTLAAASTRGVWTTVPDSEHLIAVSNPDAVIHEIFTMLDQLR